jgi:uncharacterized protein (TIGR02001 family)
MLSSIRGLFAASLVAGFAVSASPALAQDAAAAPAAEAPKPITITGNVALVTDYRFRGVSLSGGDPAIQGGITVTHKSGLYVGTWSSSIDTAYAGDQELDLFGGWTGEVIHGLTVDAGMLYYVYPGSSNFTANYFEPYASVSTTYGPAKFKAGIALAWDQKALGDDNNLYAYGNVDVAVPTTPVTVSGHVGYTDGALSPDRLAGGNNSSGWDWSIGASATVYGPLSVGVSYIGTSGRSVDSLTNDTVVGTLTASF